MPDTDKHRASVIVKHGVTCVYGTEDQKTVRWFEVLIGNSCAKEATVQFPVCGQRLH